VNTEIINILDRSGSMTALDLEACNGFNQFIDEQRGLPGEARVTTARFDHRYQIDYQALPIASVPRMGTLQPGGWTALLDAIGRTIVEQRERTEREGWAHKVIVAILTDGQENRSSRYSAHAVRLLINEMQLRGWSFVFLAANQDAFAAAEGLGIDTQHTASFAATGAGVRAGFAHISAATRQLRGITF
jgi:hypothetical protein